MVKIQNCEHGGIARNILVIILLAGIVTGVYILMRRDGVRVGNTGGTPSDAVIETDNSGEFPDGLINPVSSMRGMLDEYGAGTAASDTFHRDLNNDGQTDRITRQRIENGTAHFYYDYKIELNNGTGYTDITPDKLRTTEGAECALTKLQFSFQPEFKIIKISRPWRDTWVTPTMARKTVYTLRDGRMTAGETTNLSVVCDVASLF